MYSDDYVYADSRLAETIVRLGVEPIYVHTVGKGMIATYSPLSDMEEQAQCNVEELDLKPVPLGYCNFNKRSGYLSRVPMRRDWRQGLRRGNFTCVAGGLEASRIPYESLRQVILGDYPTFDKVKAEYKKFHAIAWHRNWAMDREGFILYKGDKTVGQLQDGVIVLRERCQYLSQALAEVV